MPAPTQHTTHISLPFEVVCERIADTDQLGVGPTAIAVRHIESAAKSADLAGFDGSTSIGVAFEELEVVNDEFARVRLRWHSGSDDRRLLPHADASILIHSVIAKGPHASTALSVVGQFSPTNGLRSHIKDLLFGRRLVDEAMKKFLDSLAIQVLDEPIDLRTDDRAPIS